MMFFKVKQKYIQNNFMSKILDIYYKLKNNNFILNMIIIIKCILYNKY